MTIKGVVVEHVKGVLKYMWIEDFTKWTSCIAKFKAGCDVC